MALENLSLVFKNDLDQIDTIEVDGTVSENHEGEVDTTDNPVEQGAPITDHARPKPELVTVEGIISATPILDSQRTSGGQPLEFPQGAPGRVEEAYAQLRALKDNPQLIMVSTYRRVYQNMLMTKLTVHVDARTGEALRFTAAFKEVRVVQTQTVKVRANAPTHTKLGKQAPTPVKDESFGAQLDDFFGKDGKTFFGAPISR